jgi:hypothetical protein
VTSGWAGAASVIVREPIDDDSTTIFGSKDFWRSEVKP